MSPNQPQDDCIQCGCPDSGFGDFTASYRIAETDLSSNFVIPPLEPYRIANRIRQTLSAPLPAAAAIRERQITTNGWLADEWRTVSCTIQRGRYRLTIAGLGDYAISPNEIAALDPSSRPHEEVITGPCLILALAMRGIFTLHAGAVTLNRRAIAFVGESGAGKSTLARWVFEQRSDDHGCIRIADDLLPIAIRGKQPTALPHFPQLKLDHQDQYTDRNSPSFPLRALFVLGGNDTPEAVVIEALPPKQAMLQIIRHTVSAKLFGTALNRAHLAFAACCAQQTPVYRLRYPRRFDALPDVIEQIRKCQETWPASP